MIERSIDFTSNFDDWPPHTERLSPRNQTRMILIIPLLGGELPEFDGTVG